MDFSRCLYTPFESKFDIKISGRCWRARGPRSPRPRPPSAKKKKECWADGASPPRAKKKKECWASPPSAKKKNDGLMANTHPRHSLREKISAKCSHGLQIRHSKKNKCFLEVLAYVVEHNLCCKSLSLGPHTNDTFLRTVCHHRFGVCHMHTVDDEVHKSVHHAHTRVECPCINILPDRNNHKDSSEVIPRRP